MASDGARAWMSTPVQYAAAVAGARGFLIGGGVVYLALWISGLVVDYESSANFVPLNSADQWLHVGLAAVMLLLGVVFGAASRTPPPQHAKPRITPD